MRYLTATQAAKHIGVTDRTVRDWIKTGKLTAHHTAPNRLAIALPDVERIARERKQYDLAIPDASEIAQRLADLEQKYADLLLKYQEMDQKYSELATSRSLVPAYPMQQEMFADIPRSRPPGRRRPTTHTAQAKEELPPDLPVGTLHVNDFAALYGVPSGTFRDHWSKGLGRGEKERVEIIERPKPGREHTGEKDRYLTPEQQAKALAFWRRYNVRFQEPNEEE